MVGTRNLWKNIVVLCVNSLTGYGIHHCFKRSMLDPEAHETTVTTMFHNFYADYYIMAGIAVASCLALCPAVGVMGRRGGLLMFMIITALASLLQLGLLNLLGKYSVQLNIERSDKLKRNFSIAFSIIGMFSSHAVSNLSIFFCAEITPTVIRGGGLGLVLASAGFGMLTAPIMELHNQKGYFLHHVIFACCTLICIICILLLPETRFQPLPETLADGECYTRQPLLPPKRPGEQRLLLAQSESSRDYTRVQDTPLHEAAATAASTMGSTASSAVDLTAPSVIDVSGLPGTEMAVILPGGKEGKDLNGRSLTPPSIVPMADFDRECVLLAGKDHLLSSTPLRKASPSATKPLLGSADDPATPLMDPSTALVDDSVPSPATVPTHPPVIIVPPPTSILDSSTPPVIEPIPTSVLVSTAPVIEPPPPHSILDSSTPPIVEAPPMSALESSTPPITETPPMSALESSTPPITETPPMSTLDSSIAPLPEPIPTSPVPPLPTPSPTPLISDIVPPPTTDCTILIDSTPPISTDSVIPILIDSASPSVDDSNPHESPLDTPSAPPPTTDCTIPSVTDTVIPPPESDSPPPCVNEVAPPSPVLASPHPPTPPPSLIHSGHPPAVDSSTPPVLTVIDAVPTPALDSTTLPITDIVQPSPLDCTTPLAIDSILPSITDSGAEAAPATASAMDYTVSSPIDSGVLPVTDCVVTETSAVNGVTSS